MTGPRGPFAKQSRSPGLTSKAHSKKDIPASNGRHCLESTGVWGVLQQTPERKAPDESRQRGRKHLPEIGYLDASPGGCTDDGVLNDKDHKTAGLVSWRNPRDNSSLRYYGTGDLESTSGCPTPTGTPRGTPLTKSVYWLQEGCPPNRLGGRLQGVFTPPRATSPITNQWLAGTEPVEIGRVRTKCTRRHRSCTPPRDHACPWSGEPPYSGRVRLKDSEANCAGATAQGLPTAASSPCSPRGPDAAGAVVSEREARTAAPAPTQEALRSRSCPRLPYASAMQVSRASRDSATESSSYGGRRRDSERLPWAGAECGRWPEASIGQPEHWTRAVWDQGRRAAVTPRRGAEMCNSSRYVPEPPYAVSY